MLQSCACAGAWLQLAKLLLCASERCAAPCAAVCQALFASLRCCPTRLASPCAPPHSSLVTPHPHSSLLQVLEVNVRPGWKEGTKITFCNKGDELSPGGPSADLVLIVRQQPHATFTRSGNDLHATLKLPLVTALTGGTAALRMPDGRTLQLPISAAQPVSHGSVRVVHGEGMPISKAPGGKGDLHVKFEVEFPRQLSQQQKEQLRHILPAQ